MRENVFITCKYITVFFSGRLKYKLNKNVVTKQELASILICTKYLKDSE